MVENVDEKHLNEQNYFSTDRNGLSVDAGSAGEPSYTDIKERVPRREVRVLKISKVLQEQQSDG